MYSIPRKAWILAWTLATSIFAFITVGYLWSPRPATGAFPKAKQAAAPVRFTESGELVRPTGYRKWMYVGTPLTPNDMNDGKAGFPEFHNVYVSPEAFDAFEKTGELPDGTVVIKELLSVGSKKASSGRGYFMGEFTGLEALVKDKSRFKDEPGNWAFFTFGHKYPLAETAKPQAVANCSACHSSLADDDFIFTQYYPVLREVKVR